MILNHLQSLSHIKWNYKCPVVFAPKILGIIIEVVVYDIIILVNNWRYLKMDNYKDHLN